MEEEEEDSEEVEVEEEEDSEEGEVVEEAFGVSVWFLPFSNENSSWFLKLVNIKQNVVGFRYVSYRCL